MSDSVRWQELEERRGNLLAKPTTCRNLRCTSDLADVEAACPPSTCRRPGILRAGNVDEIVDVSSPKFHRVQQVLVSKFLNLKMRQKGAHLRPRRMPARARTGLFSMLSVSSRWCELIEVC
jgi:hypothetical protein